MHNGQPHQRSPVSDDGRGLKLQRLKAHGGFADRSPVSDDGRGLKPGGGGTGMAGTAFARQ